MTARRSLLACATLICVDAALLETGTHTIKVDGRDVLVNVPANGGTDSYPLALLLHGHGGSGAQQMDMFVKNRVLGEVAATHILAAPSSEGKGWDYSTDINFVGVKVVDKLLAYDNVVPDVHFYGGSMGADLIARILIKNKDPRFTRAVMDSDNLRSSQTPLGELVPRGLKVLTVHALGDSVIPCCGKGSLLSWRDTAYAFAQGYGYKGPAASLAQNDTKLARVTYLNDQVQGLLFYQLTGHVISGRNNVSPYVTEFLNARQPPEPLKCEARCSRDNVVAKPESCNWNDCRGCARCLRDAAIVEEASGEGDGSDSSGRRTRSE